MNAKKTEDTITLLNRPRSLPAGATRQMVSTVLRRLELGSVSLSIAFIDDEEMADLNRTWRNREGTTDVLSFPMNETDPQGNQYLGDIAVSLPQARRQAKEAGIRLQRELMELITHGVLHLRGYDHTTDGGEMDRLETLIRREVVDLYC